MKQFYKSIFILLSMLLAQNSLALQDGTILLDPGHGGDGSGWGQKNCNACHLLFFIHDGLPIREIARKKGYQSCTGCHGQNGTDAVRPCGICHNSQDLPVSPILSGRENHNFEVGRVRNLNDQQCLSCHEASDMDGVFESDVDLTVFPNRFGKSPEYGRIYEFCLRCHNDDHQQAGFEITPRYRRDPLVAMDKNYRFIDMHGLPKGSGERIYAGLVPDYQYSTIVDCTDCHAMHGTHNPKLIVDESRKGMMSLNASKNYSIDVHEGDYSQLCVVCHRMQNIVEDGALNTGNGLSGVHMTGSDDDCRVCHTHGQAVQTGL